MNEDMIQIILVDNMQDNVQVNVQALMNDTTIFVWLQSEITLELSCQITAISSFQWAT